MPTSRLTACLAASLGAASIAALAIGCGGASDSTGANAASGVSAPERRAAAVSTCPESSQARAYAFEFTNTTAQAVTLDVDPGWECVSGSGFSLAAGWVGSQTPDSLVAVQIPPGQSATRTLRFAPEVKYATQGRFGLRFYWGNPAKLIRSVPIAFGGRRDGGGWWGFGAHLGDGDWSCRASFPTQLPDGTPAAIGVNGFGARSCGAETVRITIAPGT